MHRDGAAGGNLLEPRSPTRKPIPNAAAATPAASAKRCFAPARAEPRRRSARCRSPGPRRGGATAPGAARPRSSSRAPGGAAPAPPACPRRRPARGNRVRSSQLLQLTRPGASARCVCVSSPYRAGFRGNRRSRSARARPSTPARARSARCPGSCSSARCTRQATQDCSARSGGPGASDAVSTGSAGGSIRARPRSAIAFRATAYSHGATGPRSRR